MSSSRALASTSRLLAPSRPLVRSITTTTSPAPVLSSLPPPKPLHASAQILQPPTTVSTPSALALIASQPSHYISALLLGRRYLLTPRDVLVVPKMKGVKPGEKIELTRILELGSRDYTLRATAIMGGKMGGIEGGVTNSARGKGVTKGPLLLPASARSITSVGIPRDWQRHPDSLPTLADGIVKASLVVLEHTKGSMFEVYKFKKRKGYRRTLKSKLGFTKLRMGDIVIGNGEGIVE